MVIAELEPGASIGMELECVVDQNMLRAKSLMGRKDYLILILIDRMLPLRCQGFHYL